MNSYREALQGDDREAIEEALDVLGEIGGKDVLPELLERADIADKQIEHRAIEALRKLAEGDESCRQYLLEQIPDSTPELRVNILRALRGLGNPELCRHLSRFLPTDNSKFRYYMAGVCSDVKDPACLDLLSQLCQDESLHVATYAVVLLCRNEDSESRRLALQLARDENRPLVLISYLRGFYLNRQREFVPVVEKILSRSADRRVRYYAAAALKALDPSRLKELAREDNFLASVVHDVRVDSL